MSIGRRTIQTYAMISTNNKENILYKEQCYVGKR
jgi:hypothetical protein